MKAGWNGEGTIGPSPATIENVSEVSQAIRPASLPEFAVDDSVFTLREFFDAPVIGRIGEKIDNSLKARLKARMANIETSGRHVAKGVF